MTQSQTEADRVSLAASDKAAALALTPVSRETEARLDRYVALARGVAGQDQSGRALDASESLDPAHRRFAPASRSGSVGESLGRPRQRRRLSRRGAGLRTGGDAGRDGPSGRAQRQEGRLPARSDSRHGLAGTVHLAEIGDTVDRIAGPVDCVTARALAPLHQLIGFAEPLVRRGAKALFLKGQDVEAELTEATKYWNIQAATSFQPHRRTGLDRRARSHRAAQQPSATANGNRA